MTIISPSFSSPEKLNGRFLTNVSGICFSTQCARGDGDSGQASPGSERSGGGGSGGPCGPSGGRFASPSSSSPPLSSSTPTRPPPRSSSWVPWPLTGWRNVDPWQGSDTTTGLA